MSRVTLKGSFTRFDDAPATGTVKIISSRSPITDPDNQVIISGPQTFPLDEDGKIEVSLPATDDPSMGEAWTYDVIANMSHSNWQIRGLTLPSSMTTVDLSNPPSGVVKEYPTRQEWEALIDPVVAEAVAAAVRAELAREESEATVLVQGDWAGAVDLTALAERPNYLVATLTGNVSLTLPTPGPERAFTVTLDLTQDSTGGHDLEVVGLGWSWSAQGVPHPDPGAESIIHLLWNGFKWVGAAMATNIGIPASGGV